MGMSDERYGEDKPRAEGLAALRELNARDRAVARAQDLCDAYGKSPQEYVDRLAALLLDARNEALDDAAKVADETARLHRATLPSDTSFITGEPQAGDFTHGNVHAAEL